MNPSHRILFFPQTVANKLEDLKKAEVEYFTKGREPDYAKNEFVLILSLSRECQPIVIFSEFNYTQWESKEVFEQRFLEKMDDEQVIFSFRCFRSIRHSLLFQYKTMIICLNRLAKHPLAYTIKDYINSFRTKLSDTIAKQQIEPVSTDSNPKSLH